MVARVLVPAVLGCLVLLAAGCGGASTVSVARLGTTTASRHAVSGSSTSGAGSGTPTAASWVAYSACLDAHGVPNTPALKGGILLAGKSDPSTLAAAQKACQKLNPQRGPLPKLTQAQKDAWLSYSRCMRSNGVPNFPDPTFVDNDTGIKLDTRGLEPHSPLFEAAGKACEDAFPLHALRKPGQN